MNVSFAKLIDIINSNNQREEYSRQSQQQYNQSQSQSANTTSLFDGCDTLDSLKARYRQLCKVYHTDNGNGSDKVFAELQNEFERLKKQYS